MPYANYCDPKFPRKRFGERNPAMEFAFTEEQVMIFDTADAFLSEVATAPVIRQ